MSARAACFDCARKHLAQACALAIEAELGYPAHAWLAIGHMAEAEAELADRALDTAALIRGYRTAYTSSLNSETGVSAQCPPFIELIVQITALAAYDEPDHNTASIDIGTQAAGK